MSSGILGLALSQASGTRHWSEYLPGIDRGCVVDLPAAAGAPRIGVEIPDEVALVGDMVPLVRVPFVNGVLMTAGLLPHVVGMAGFTGARDGNASSD